MSTEAICSPVESVQKNNQCREIHNGYVPGLSMKINIMTLIWEAALMSLGLKDYSSLLQPWVLELA